MGSDTPPNSTASALRQMGATAHRMIAGRGGVVAVIGMAGRLIGRHPAVVRHPRVRRAVQEILAVP